MDYVNIIIPFVGGLGMFIYGMQIMSQGRYAENSWRKDEAVFRYADE